MLSLQEGDYCGSLSASGPMLPNNDARVDKTHTHTCSACPLPLARLKANENEHCCYRCNSKHSCCPRATAIDILLYRMPGVVSHKNWT